ncbi:MAG: DUF2203 domain-containing protein [Gemmatimonadota bacterium]|nr:MAG: DUF2203 domain-containing protein [Gemmatimonadota bacterium]
MADKSIRYFTVEEANRTLPYVRPIVSDIVRSYKSWQDGVRRYEVIAAGSRSELGETKEQVALREEVEKVAQQITGYLDELSAVGCVFKGFDDGLVDFFSQLEGRDIFLCWKLGEAEITHWHELDAGFAGRRELEPDLVQEGSE